MAQDLERLLVSPCACGTSSSQSGQSPGESQFEQLLAESRCFDNLTEELTAHVQGAGSEHCNGSYVFDGVQNERYRFRRVGSSLTISHHQIGDRGWWLLNEDYTGENWYKMASDALEPPADGWDNTWTSGKAPAPQVSICPRNSTLQECSAPVNVTVEHMLAAGHRAKVTASSTIMSDTFKRVNMQQSCMKLNELVRHSIYEACAKSSHAVNIIETSTISDPASQRAQTLAIDQCDGEESAVLSNTTGTGPSLSADTGDAQGQDADASPRLPCMQLAGSAAHIEAIPAKRSDCCEGLLVCNRALRRVTYEHCAMNKGMSIFPPLTDVNHSGTTSNPKISMSITVLNRAVRAAVYRACAIYGNLQAPINEIALCCAGDSVNRIDTTAATTQQAVESESIAVTPGSAVASETPCSTELKATGAEPGTHQSKHGKASKLRTDASTRQAKLQAASVAQGSPVLQVVSPALRGGKMCSRALSQTSRTSSAPSAPKAQHSEAGVPPTDKTQSSGPVPTPLGRRHTASGPVRTTKSVEGKVKRSSTEASNSTIAVPVKNCSGQSPPACTRPSSASSRRPATPPPARASLRPATPPPSSAKASSKRPATLPASSASLRRSATPPPSKASSQRAATPPPSSASLRRPATPPPSKASSQRPATPPPSSASLRRSATPPPSKASSQRPGVSPHSSASLRRSATPPASARRRVASSTEAAHQVVDCGPLKVELPRAKPGQKFGIKFDDGQCTVVQILPGGRVQDWNVSNPATRIKVGAKLVTVNGEACSDCDWRLKLSQAADSSVMLELQQP